MTALSIAVRRDAMRLSLAMALSLASAWPACAEEVPKVGEAASSTQAVDIDPCMDANGQIETRDLTAIVGLHPCWKAESGNDSYRLMNDLYAQWTITRVERNGHSDRPRDYGRESRPGILRWLIGKDRSVIASVNVEMHDPDVKFTIPLAAFGYEGRVGKGESWTTDVVSDDQSQPFFRIGPSTSATIAVSAKSSTNVEVRATSSILGAVRTISSIVSPGGSLVTSLNEQPLAEKASAIDNALSSIWSETKEEKQISGRQLSEWYEGAYFLIQVTVPDFVRTKKDDAEVPNTRWYKLQLSCPRYSIFDPKPACEDNSKPTLDPKTQYRNDGLGYATWQFQEAVERLYYRVSAQQILNYPLSQGKTLQEFLASQSYYTRFLRLGEPTRKQGDNDTPPQQTDPARGGETALAPSADNGSGGSETPTPRSRGDYSSFCRSTVDALYGAKLSSFDARLGLWAAVVGSLDLVTLNDRFNDNPDCRVLLPGTAKGLWQFVGPKEPK